MANNVNGLSFFGQRNILQDFSFDINGYFNLYKGVITSLMNKAFNLLYSSNWFLKILGCGVFIVNFLLSVLYGLGSSIIILFMCIAQYIINLVGFLFWGLSGFANSFIAIFNILWHGVITLFQILWVRFVVFASFVVGAIVPGVVALNNKIITMISSLSVNIPTIDGDFEGIAWFIFNYCDLNYFLSKSLTLLLWCSEILILVFLGKKIFNIIRLVFK